MAEVDDWRRMGQDSYLPAGTTWVRRHYAASEPTSDHDHCVMCTTKFVDPSTSVGAELLRSGDDVLTAGLTTTVHNQQAWVCEGCFSDFKAEFGWEIGQA